MTMGDRIKNRRIELGITQQELAEKMGFKTRSHISLLEQGDRNIPISKIKKLANALEISPEYLMGWEDNMETTTTNTGNHNTNNYYSDCGSSAKEAIEFLDKDSALHRIMDLLLTHKKEFKRSDLEWLKQNIDFFLNEIEIPRN